MSKSVEFNGTAFNKVVILKEIIEATIDAETNLDVSNDADKNDKTRKGLVMQVGHDVPKDDKGIPYVCQGNYVLYNRHAASNLTHEGVKYKLIYYDDLILKL
jgi:co-chaperonin GroES (HSP10)